MLTFNHFKAQFSYYLGLALPIITTIRTTFLELNTVIILYEVLFFV